MICNCNRPHGHLPDCLVAQAMKFRCPHCHSKRRTLGIRHAKSCPLKGFQP